MSKKVTKVHIKFPSGHLGAEGGEHPMVTALRVIAVGFGEPDSDGWPDKYGITFENNVFLMHPYCWCEDSGCRWCSDSACGCPEGDCEFYVDAKQVSGEEHWEWNKRIIGDLWGAMDMSRSQRKEWKRRIAERDARLVTVYPRRVHTCEPRGMMADRDWGLDWRPSQSAPHFWFKPTGFKLWWYKYIGRDMESNDAEIPPDFLEQVFASHPTGMTVEAAFEEMARRTEQIKAGFAAMIEAINSEKSPFDFGEQET